MLSAKNLNNVLLEHVLLDVRGTISVHMELGVTTIFVRSHAEVDIANQVNNVTIIDVLDLVEMNFADKEQFA